MVVRVGEAGKLQAERQRTRLHDGQTVGRYPQERTVNRQSTRPGGFQPDGGRPRRGREHKSIIMLSQRSPEPTSPVTIATQFAVAVTRYVLGLTKENVYSGADLVMGRAAYGEQRGWES